MTGLSEQKPSLLDRYSLDAITHSCTHVSYRALASHWNMPLELATDLTSLALYDIVIYADDSGSMVFEEGGDRINDLKLILGRVAEVCSSPPLLDSPSLIQCAYVEAFH